VIEAIPASNDVNLPGLATTETLTRHVNLNYFSEAVSWKAKSGWRMPILAITGNPQVSFVGRIVSINAPAVTNQSLEGSRLERSRPCGGRYA